MADAAKLARAQETYRTLCAAIEKRNWKYTRHDDDLVVTFGVRGDDLPMDFVLIVDVDRQLIRLSSRMPFTVPEDKRIEGAIVTSYATYRITDGSFDYNMSDGRIAFRMTASFLSSKIGVALFEYMIDCSCGTVDRYNDRFFAVSKGLMSVEEFINTK